MFLGEDTGIDCLGSDHTAVLVEDLELQPGAGLDSPPAGENVLAVDKYLARDVVTAEKAKLALPLLPM